MLHWGHILHLFSQKLDAGSFYERRATALQHALCSRDVEAFADGLSDLLAISLRGTREMLLELGFPAEQLA